MSKASLFKRIDDAFAKRNAYATTNRLGIEGYDIASKQKDLEEAIKSMWENSRPVIRTQVEAFDPINKSGKFKNAFQKGSIADWDEDALKFSRKPTEDFLFGKMSASERPIYGYIEPNELDLNNDFISCNWQPEIENYGPVKFYPKKEAVGDRSTFTIGDSEFDEGIPFRLNHPEDVGALGRKNAVDEGKWELADWPDIETQQRAEDVTLDAIRNGVGKDGTFVEAQIFGGIPLTDIGRVDTPADNFYELGITKQQAVDYANKFGYNLNLTDSDEKILECLANCPE